jgi:hypothetical protein
MMMVVRTMKFFGTGYELRGYSQPRSSSGSVINCLIHSLRKRMGATGMVVLERDAKD